MAKRFIDTTIFEKRFASTLDAPHKLFFIYYMTKCDHAGIFDKHAVKLASYLLDFDYYEETISELFGEKLVDLDTKWFMPSFIEFQYGELNSANRAHNSVINILIKHNIDVITLNLSKENKPLISPLKGAKDKDKDKDKDKVKVKEVILPHGKLFSEAWEEWKQYKIEKRSKLTPTSIKRQLATLTKLKEADAIATINQSIENNYQGLFPDKITGNGKSTVNSSLQNTNQY